jgi:ligand-binding sensor domain-containing protein/AraC-like DNA-binding protein
MWFGTWDGVCRWDGYNYKIYKSIESDTTTIAENRILSMMTDATGNIWIKTNNRIICRYNYDKDCFNRLKPNLVSASVRSVLDRRVNHIPVLERDGILFTGTLNEGVVKTNLRPKPFKKYKDFASVKDSILSSNIRAICTDKAGNLWIGTNDKGISVIHRVTGKITNYQRNQKDPLAGLISNQIRKLYCDKFGNMWIGTKNGLDQLDVKTGKFRHYHTLLAKKIPHNWVYWVCEDKDDNLWIGTWQGIARYNRLTDSFQSFPVNKTTGNPQVRVILQDESKSYWVAKQYGGVTKLTINKNGHFGVTHFSHSDSNVNTLSSNRVYCMTFSPDKNLWVGTSRGISIINTLTGKTERLKLPFGEEAVYGIISTGDDIWLSHIKGIARINIKTHRYAAYTNNDGLSSTEFNEDAYWLERKSNTIYFGGTNGLVFFQPDSILSEKPPKQAVLTRLTVNNVIVVPTNIDDAILEKQLFLTKQIKLKESQNNIAIEFSALHFSNPMGNRYKYRLQPYDSTWIETDALHRVAEYKNLKAGNYTFEVYSSNSDGVWSPKAARLQIHVLHGWWLSIPALIFYALLSMGIFVLILNYLKTKSKVRKLAHENRLKEKQNKNLLKMNRVENNGNQLSDDFLARVTSVIEENMENKLFKIEQLCEILGVGRTQLALNIKQATNQTVLEFMTTIRMNRATKYLLSGQYSISEVSWKTGFSDHSNFTRAFTKFFGMSPKEYVKVNSQSDL